MSSTAPRGLVVDWGGVVTQPLRECLAEWAETEGLDPNGIMEELTSHITGEHNPLQQLERGELTRPDVESWLADAFAGHGPRPEPQGIFDRMFAPIRTNPDMILLLKEARRRGLRTGLLSNSWGDSYDRRDWDEAFDAVVISGDVGMRKPERAIFDHVLALIDLSPQDVVYVDDEYPNVLAASSYGLRAVHCDPHDPQRITRITAALAWH
jgi:FMN phosphatase YigB (HAD superfamily)